MSTWRRLPVAVAALVAALGAYAPSAWSQDPAPPDQLAPGDQVVHSWALSPAGSQDPGEAGNRPNLSYEVEPGAEVTDGITLFNYSNVQLTFRVFATDAFNNNDGQFDLLPTGEEPKELGAWITLPQENITVGPQSQATMPITLKVPADARPGDHAGAILASSAAQGTGPDGNMVTFDRRTGSRVYVRVAGPLDPDLTIESVKTTYQPALNPLGGTAEVSYRIQNQGNVRMGGVHSVSISGPFGVMRKSIPAEDLAELLPGEGVTVKVSFDGVPATGVAFTKVRLEPAAGEGSTEEAEATDRSGVALAPPITLILVAIAAWLALRARRAYRRHRLADEPLEAQPA